MLNKELLSVYGFRRAHAQRRPTCRAYPCGSSISNFNAAAGSHVASLGMSALLSSCRYPILLTQCHMAACSIMAYGVASAGVVPRVPLKSRCAALLSHLLR